MRGEKSIEKGNNVLYVIDGIPMYNHSFGGDGGTYAKQAGSESAADINPEDIESINMLTGPSAAALYGSDAANGVVVINTKRGVKDRTGGDRQQQHDLFEGLPAAPTCRTATEPVRG